MISCDKYQAGIVALFDNEARDEDLRLAAGHLQDCPECRAFCLELIGIRRTLASVSTPSLPPAARQAVLNGVKADESYGEQHAKSGKCLWTIGRLGRWAAVLVIAVLLILCAALSRETTDLRDRLQAAERQVALIHEEDQVKEAQEKQQKAISALSFRMAELEERVNRSSRPERASFPAQVYERPGRQSNL
jgi:predicted anti-sigma-YlaC factor YlaD